MKKLLLKILNRVFINTWCGNRTFNNALETIIGTDVSIEDVNSDAKARRIRIGNMVIITFSLDENGYVTGIAVDELN